MDQVHPYQADSREWVLVSLAIVSVLLVWLLDVGLDSISFEPPWWISAPSFVGIYTLLYKVFDLHLWRLGLLRSLKLVEVPDLNGKWSGWVKSSHTQSTVANPVSVYIRQSWSKIVFRLETEHSRSNSIAAAIRTDDLPYPEFVHLYVNEPKSTALDTMNIHKGTATLELKGTILEGEYYSGRGRREFGTLRLCRDEGPM
ncbi:MAG: hypothetical protein OXE05_02530 [Chloroflexi bacterium]|nr:hypothetical protein [Chloroflexota bacterium]